MLGPVDFDNPQSFPSRSHVTNLPYVELEICQGRAQLRRRRVHPPVFLIGRDPQCDLVLADESFPPIHTYVFIRRSGVSVRHLGKGPELMVGGRVVRTALLHDRDRLRMGPYEFVIKISSDPPALLPQQQTRQVQVSAAEHAVRDLLSEIHQEFPTAAGDVGNLNIV